MPASIDGAWFVFAGYAAVSYAILQRVNEQVDTPYMDEVFHVPQAQRYCQGRFGEWDDKLTTPPGLYLLSLAPVQALRAAGMGGYCSTHVLRGTNWALSLALFWVIRMLLEQLRPQRAGSNRLALELALFPVTFFLNHLYYTDTASLLSVLLMYLLCLRRRHWAAAAAGFASLWLRQTNVVWVAFAGFTAALDHVRVATGDSLSAVGIAAAARWTVRMTRRDCWAISRVLAPYLAVVASFAAFVVVNGGIVLGDKAHHQAGVHVVQVFYFYAYVVGSSAPVFLMASPVWFVRCMAKKPLRNCLLVAVGFVAMALLVSRFTVEHPFLLSDNRHYPFYLWKNVFRRHWLCRYLAIPVYVYAISAVHKLLAGQVSDAWQLALMLCTAAVLVPAPLLEFRYFAVPYYLVRLHARPLPRHIGVLSILWFALINAVTLWVFLYRPFTWPSEPGRQQRFMW
ncbi:glucosyltransferase [Coemansia sp. Benny D115]|nr:glucosyltransferase [Coemansia sp. Benny D115]